LKLKNVLLISLIMGQVIFANEGTIFPIKEGNKWWYESWESSSWAGGPNDYSSKLLTMEITKVDADNKNIFFIDKKIYYPDCVSIINEKYYSDSTIIQHLNFSGSEPLLLFKSDINDTTFVHEKGDIRVRILNSTISFIGHENVPCQHFRSGQFGGGWTRHKYIIPDIGIVYFENSYIDPWGANSDYEHYYLQKWRINDIYYGKPSAPENVNSVIKGDSLLINWHQSPENNVSHYNIYLMNYKDKVIDSCQSSYENPLYNLLYKKEYSSKADIPQKIKVSATSFEGYRSNYSIVDSIEGVNENFKKVVNSFKIIKNYPNPFNNSTTITFDIDRYLKVNLSIYNILGEKIETIIDAALPIGKYQYNWNSKNQPSGIYVIRLDADSKTSLKKCTLLK